MQQVLFPAGFTKKKKVITPVPNIIVNVSSVSKDRNCKDILNS